MGQTLGYSLGTETPEGSVVTAPDEFAMIGAAAAPFSASTTSEHPRPVFTAVPMHSPAPAVASMMKPLPRGVQADIGVRRALARKLGEDIHSSLFGVSSLKDMTTGKLSLDDYEYSVLLGETQGPQLRREFVAMIISELNKAHATAKSDQEFSLSETSTEELDRYRIKIRGPAAYLKYRWRRGWDMKSFYVIVATDKQHPVIFDSELVTK